MEVGSREIHFAGDRWSFGRLQCKVVGFGVYFEGAKLDVECDRNEGNKIVKCSTYF